MRRPVIHSSIAVLFLVLTWENDPIPGPEPDLPVASFTASADTLLVGDIVYFQSTCENAISIEWDFGDGTGSSEEYPNHVYTEEGEYVVDLKVANEDGADVKSQYLLIKKVYPCRTKLAGSPEDLRHYTSVAYNHLVYILAYKGLRVEAYNPVTNERSNDCNIVESYDPTCDTE